VKIVPLNTRLQDASAITVEFTVKEVDNEQYLWSKMSFYYRTFASLNLINLIN